LCRRTPANPRSEGGSFLSLQSPVNALRPLIRQLSASLVTPACQDQHDKQDKEQEQTHSNALPINHVIVL
jgi:hypothetical protein